MGAATCTRCRHCTLDDRKVAPSLPAALPFRTLSSAQGPSSAFGLHPGVQHVLPWRAEVPREGTQAMRLEPVEAGALRRSRPSPSQSLRRHRTCPAASPPSWGLALPSMPTGSRELGVDSGGGLAQPLQEWSPRLRRPEGSTAQEARGLRRSTGLGARLSQAPAPRPEPHGTGQLPPHLPRLLRDLQTWRSWCRLPAGSGGRPEGAAAVGESRLHRVLRAEASALQLLPGSPSLAVRTSPPRASSVGTSPVPSSLLH